MPLQYFVFRYMTGYEIIPILIYTISFLRGENMIEFLLCPVLSLLLLGNMLVAFYYVDNAGNIEKKESQKLDGECLDQ